MGFLDRFKRAPEKAAEANGLRRRLTGSTPLHNSDRDKKQWHITSKFDVDRCNKGGCTATFGHYATIEDAELELKYIKKNVNNWKRLNVKQEGLAKTNPNVKWDYNSKPESHR